MVFLKTLFLFVLLGLKVSVAAQLDFVALVPFGTPKNADIFLTGSIPGNCNWKPNCLRFNFKEAGVYTLQINIPDEVTKFDYKITRGTYDTEAADSYSHPLHNFTYEKGKNKNPLVHSIVNWKDFEALGTTSNVLSPISIFSTELNISKDISIYLPPDYYTSSKYYPVLYMHDGQNVFDPKLSNYGVEWEIDETMNKLIRDGQIQSAIVVAIHTNETDREWEYDYYLKGKKYSDFVVNKVIPYTELNFRAIKDKKARYLMGSSMGALISLMMIIDRPDIFSKVAGLSFPANIKKRAIFRFLDERKVIPKFDFYMDHGNWGIDSRYEVGASELFKVLKSRGINSNYQIFPFADHSEADWARRAYVPLDFLLGN